MNRAEAEAQASFFKHIQDDDDADEPDDDDGDDDGNKKKSLNLIRVIDFMLSSGFSVADTITHITYQTTLTAPQITELTTYIIGNSSSSKEITSVDGDESEGEDEDKEKDKNKGKQNLN